MRNPVTFVLAVVPVLGALATTGTAREWEWSYDPGASWPEELPGWKHAYEGADRKLGGGQIHFDSREPYGIWDGYRIEFPNGGLSPGPHETFIARARVKVDYVDTFYGDAGLFMAGDVGSEVYGGSIIIGVKGVWGGGKHADIEPDVFHEYEVRSRNMLEYELLIDGSLAWRANFYHGNGVPRISWGDYTSRRGVSHFEYVSFAVVSDYRLLGASARDASHEYGIAPEPGPFLALSLLLAARPRARSATLVLSG